MPCVHNRAASFSVRSANPLRTDPTRTGLQRRAFIAAINRRFDVLSASVTRYLVELDMLGLGGGTTLRSVSSLIGMAEFEFTTDPAKLLAFNQWFRAEVERLVLSGIWTSPTGSIATGPWVTKFLYEAYRRGMTNAFMAAKATGSLNAAATLDQFLLQGFTAENASRVAFLASRTFEGLKGITGQMSADMSRILAQGMLRGDSISKIARAMTNQIDGLPKDRAMMIARTEIIAAHAEGQLDTFASLGIDQLGIKAEWTTAGDERVCPECADREGQLFTVDEARGLIPLHPNCRCTWTPAEVSR